MLKVLRGIVQGLLSSTDLAAALTQVALGVRQALKADACCVYVGEMEGAQYVLTAVAGYPEIYLGKLKIRLGEGLVGQVAAQGEALSLHEGEPYPSYEDQPEIDSQFHSFLAVPIVHQAEVLGVLVASQIQNRLFTEEEEAFLITLSAQIASHLASVRSKTNFEPQQKQKRRATGNQVFKGIAGASGIAFGTGFVVYPKANLDSVPDRRIEDITAEIALFEQALSAAKEEIYQLQQKAWTSLSMAESVLFDAYLRILDSRSLIEEVVEEIRAGLWAQGALRNVIKRHILQFEGLGDPYLQERATDFRDLGHRVLARLQSQEEQTLEYPKDTILISEELTATMLMEVPEGHTRGLISTRGSANSHVAILARALGIPCVMGLEQPPLAQLEGKFLILDGYSGDVYVSPASAIKKEFQLLATEEQQLNDELQRLRDLPACTPDGHRLGLYVNTGLAVEMGMSLSVGAEGIGLYRTELPFLMRDRFPSEEEQRTIYRQLLKIFAPRPVVIRTLDIGGDKMLPYFPFEETNPFLGWRGIRVSLDHPEIFLQQVRAMLRASIELNNLKILLPMISSVREVESALALIQQAFDEIKPTHPEVVMPWIGVMIEVPSAVYQAHSLAQRVDFLSVGSNDLIQYLLAVDRNNPRVAHLYDGFHPAVLQALQQVVTAGHKAKKPVTICGELASDPLMVILLMAMGFDALSMNARCLPRMKWVVRSFSLEFAKQLLKEVMAMDDSVEIRCHLEMVLDQAGLGGLIRAGGR